MIKSLQKVFLVSVPFRQVTVVKKNMLCVTLGLLLIGQPTTIKPFKKRQQKFKLQILNNEQLESKDILA